MPANGVLRIFRERSNEIDELRTIEYRHSTEFYVPGTEFLKWDGSDESGVVLAVQSHDGILLATMCGVPVATMKDQITNCLGSAELLSDDSIHASVPDLSGSVLFLRRAATRLECRSSGFNTLLRLAFVDLARQLGCRYIAGEVFAGTGRWRLMQEMGYQLLFVGQCLADNDFVSANDYGIAVLDLYHEHERAVAVMRNRLQSLPEEYPILTSPAGLLPKT